VLDFPSGWVKVIAYGVAGIISGSIDATAITDWPDAPSDGKEAPTKPLSPAAMVTITPVSTMRDAIVAQALAANPPLNATLQVIISAYLKF
jgi:hypothetical protein